MMDERKDLLPYFCAILGYSLFGLSFFATKTALELYSPMQVLGYRFLIAALFLTALRWFKVIRIDLKGKHMVDVLLVSIAQPVFYFIFETLGLQRTESSMAGIILALLPIVVIGMAVVVLGERPGKKQLVCSGISMVGVFIILFSAGISLQSGQAVGIFLLFLAMVCGAAYSILSRRCAEHFTPIEITYVMMWSGAIFFNYICMVKYGPQGRALEYFIEMFQPQGLLAILYLGILCSCIGFFGINYALNQLQASRMSVFSNITTVVSIAAGVLFRGEPFVPIQAVGAAIVLFGVYGTNRFVPALQLKKGVPEHEV